MSVTRAASSRTRGWSVSSWSSVSASPTAARFECGLLRGRLLRVGRAGLPQLGARCAGGPSRRAEFPGDSSQLKRATSPFTQIARHARTATRHPAPARKSAKALPLLSVFRLDGSVSQSTGCPMASEQAARTAASCCLAKADWASHSGSCQASARIRWGAVRYLASKAAVSDASRSCSRYIQRPASAGSPYSRYTSARRRRSIRSFGKDDTSPRRRWRATGTRPAARSASTRATVSLSGISA